MPKKLNIIIICGGPSNERDVSLKTGEQVFKALPKKYNSHLVEIKKNGRWLLRGSSNKQLASGLNERGLLVSNPKRQSNIDVAFIAMHGKFGEDGKIQALLETAGISYTGSGVLASALGMNKRKTLEIVAKYGIKTPKLITLNSRAILKKQLAGIKKEIAQKIGYPCVVKPNESGSSIGISIVRSSGEVPAALRRAFNEDSSILIEEYIKGLELTCAVMGNSGQTSLLALPPIEILPANEFFDYDSKYSSVKTQEICPARISKRQTNQLQGLAKKVHEIIGCDGLSRSDFILTARNAFYFLEINTIPGLTEGSLSPKAAKAYGLTFSEFLDKQIQLALLKKNK